MKLDLTDDSAVKAFINDLKPDFVVHCAAQRQPDKVESDFESARALNVESSRILAASAAAYGGKVLYISTDYVFSGAKGQAPYDENDETGPLNKYGRLKLEGEKAVLGNGQHIVLRVPILYGPVQKLEESAVTVLFSALKDVSKECLVNDVDPRFPSHVDDVAYICSRLMEKNAAGTFQWSGLEKMTKYDMVMAMAKEFGLTADHVKAAKDVDSVAKRPYDVQMKKTALEAVGIEGKHTEFTKGISNVLKSYVQ